MRSFLTIVLALAFTANAAAQHKGKTAWVGGPTHPDGTVVPCHIPTSICLKNVGGSDGAGLCVFTSISHSAIYQNVPCLQDFRDWMRKYPGGGYPEKVDKMIAKLCQERQIPVPDYVQVQSNDLEILKLASRTGRPAAVTYGYSPSGRYGGQRISHMVSLMGAGVGKGPDGKGWYCILDNNFPDTIEWLSEAEFAAAYRSGGGKGWAFILLAPGAPPVPK